MIGIIGGTGFYETGFLGETKEREVETVYGTAYILVGEKFLFIPRHGKNRDIPPHRINHRANITALKEQGVGEVIGVSSAGSLKKDIPPRSLVVPDDYINLWNTPTFFDSEIVHITPGLNEDLRNNIISSAKRLGMDVIGKGTYIQTSGPRLETKAEVSLLKNYADIVGMTMASEATLAKEKGIRYANISSVDNYAHGMTEEKLDFREVALEASRNRVDLNRLLKGVVREL
jgi:5'-methylthioadenosine phosphorylase